MALRLKKSHSPPKLGLKLMLNTEHCQCDLYCFAVLSLLLIGLAGCTTTYSPRQKDQVGFYSRMEVHHQGNIEVSAVALGPKETEEFFGVDMMDKGIQPVWLRIRNNAQRPYWLFPVSLDAEYYSPHEASWINHFSFSSQANREMDRYFRKHEVFRHVLPGHAVSGFVYTRIDQGMKAIKVDLKSIGHDEKTFLFALPVPGMQLDRDEINFEQLYSPDEVLEIQDLEVLRQWIEQLPCCTVDEEGNNQGDPLNLVFIGMERDVMAAFVQRKWRPTEKLTLATVRKTVLAFLSGSKYLYSPVSPLYLFSRKQDWAMQKARETIDERNHLRLWLAPARFQGKPIWVGQISRDIGVRFTGKINPPTTHVIDPEVDEARSYLLQDLLLTNRVYMGALAKGVGMAFQDEPRFNLMGDPYYTDGLRLVLFIGDKPVNVEEMFDLDWEKPPLMIYIMTDDED